MHELSVTENILKIALDEAERYNALKVNRIQIKMGSLEAYVPECIEEYFALLSEDTKAYGAVLDFTVEETLLRCRDCNKEFGMEYGRMRCPYCRSVKTDIISGKGFSVESLEIETEDE